MYLPVVHSWRLNERHYGALSGLNKAETAAKFGDDHARVAPQHDTPPPALEPTDERAPFNDPRYAKVPREQLPLTECLKDTVARVLPLERVDRPGGARRQAGADRRARQLAAR